MPRGLRVHPPNTPCLAFSHLCQVSTRLLMRKKILLGLEKLLGLGGHGTGCGVLSKHLANADDVRASRAEKAA